MPSNSSNVALPHEDLERLSKGWLPSDADLADAYCLENWKPELDELGIPILVGIDSRTGLPIETGPVLWASDDCTIARGFIGWFKIGKPARPPEKS